MLTLSEWPRAWRLAITSLPLQAVTIGLLSTVLAKILWTIAPAGFAAFDWSVYDVWLRHRTPVAVSPALTIVARDPASEERFGSILDRSLLAQLITGAHEAGAAAIGVDHRLDHASPASLGGAASDALLLEAIQAAGPLLFVYDADSALESDRTVKGHVMVLTQPDHMTRQIPIMATVETVQVRAFGSLLYDLARQPASPGTPMLVAEPTTATLANIVGNGSMAALPTVALTSVWDAMLTHDKPQLEGWFKGKVVVILPNQQTTGPWLLPTGTSVPGIVLHVHLLNSLLTDSSIRAVAGFGKFIMTLMLASCIAWCLLRFDGSVGLALAAAIATSYVALTAVLLPGLHVVFPLAWPLTAALFVIIGTTVWTHWSAGQRMLLLEHDMLRLQQDAAAVREALTVRETRAEALEEDLETAKAAVAQSRAQQEELARNTASLHLQIAEALDQEQAARQRLATLEHQLNDLRAASTDSIAVGDAELEGLKRDCRQLGIITQDPRLLRMYRDVKKGAASSLTVLLLGEPGTGKELFARAVHRLSLRASKPFVAVNMAAISPELFESELFGHVKGSFTGASTDRRGYFELANSGTIFLDEIGDLRLDHQSKLLRVLQEKSFYRVGATLPTTVDVRIVAATNRDLQRGVSDGWFREDLYFRLKGLVFYLPPLRERAGDIPVIAQAVLADMAQQMARPVPQLSNEASRILKEYGWPGNVRELRHALERAVALGEGSVLTRHSFSFDGLSRSDQEMPSVTPALPDSAGDNAVLDCLREHRFDMQATAKALAWDRGTVTQRLKGLCFQALLESHGDLAKAAHTIAGEASRVRIVELKLTEYYNHLLSVIKPFSSVDEALADCRRRFKNLPDRHFASVESLVRRHFQKPEGR